MRFYIFFLFLPFFLYAGSRLYLGPEVFYRNYHEIIEGAAKSDEYGVLYGFQAGYEFCASNYYFQLFGNFSRGQTTYDGTLIYIEEQRYEPCLSITQNQIVDVELNLSLSNHFENQKLITPLLGVGYHEWFREGEEVDDYDEKYSWIYLLAGCKIEKFSCTKKMGVSLKFLYTENAQVEIFRLFPKDLVLHLDNRFQYAINLYGQVFYRYLDVKLDFFYKTENIGGSPKELIEGYILSIPPSKTYQVGAQIQFGVHF